MAIPRVNLRKIKRQNSFVYMIDFTINGQRIRETVGSNKNNALINQARIQSDLSLGKYELYQKSRKQITLDFLIAVYLNSKVPG